MPTCGTDANALLASPAYSPAETHVRVSAGPPFPQRFSFFALRQIPPDFFPNPLYNGMQYKGGGFMEVMEERRVLRLPLSDIRPNPAQPRRVFEENALRDLASSIRRHGVLQPLTVRRQPGGWELVAGERRLRAARLAGLETVPCIEAEIGDQDSALLALVENLQREDLHYFEEAEAIAAYIRESGVTQEEAAAQLGRSPSAVANKLRLLRLSPACREILSEGGLTERHARAILRLEDDEERLRAIRAVIRKGMNVAQTEQYIEKRLEDLESTPPAGRRTFIVKDVRLFLNSLDRGLKLIRDAGIDADCGRVDTEDDILLTIRIPKYMGKHGNHSASAQ